MKINFNFHQATSAFITPLLILTIVVVGYFILMPGYRDLRDSKGVLADKKAEVALKESQLSGVEELISDYNGKKDKLSILDDTIPDAPRIPELIANIESLVQNSGLLMSNLQVSLPKTLTKAEAGQSVTQFQSIEGILGSTENLGVLQIDLVLKGKYINLKSFLQNLEANLRLMDSQSLTFSAVERETGFQEYAVRIQTYYYKQAKQ